MILFNDFKSEYELLRSDIDSAVKRVLSSGWFIMGNELRAFEEEFAAYTGAQYCVGVANGTDAITLGLKALGLEEGDEVITTSVTAYPTITGIVRSGAIPVVVDVLGENGLIDVDRVKEAVTSRTKAIVPVHLYGEMCDMDSLMDISESTGIPVLEDCAQASGSTYKGQKSGTFGKCSTFSFYPTKNLGAYGDAGAVVTSDPEVRDRLVQLRNYGETSRYYHDTEGLNSRLDEIQAAILRVKLPHLDSWNQMRKDNAACYRENLRGVDFMKSPEYSDSNYHLFVIRVEKRERFTDYLKENGVPSLLHYPVPVNRQNAFTGVVNGETVHADNFTDSICSLPVHPWLREEDLKRISEVVNAYS